MYIKKNNLQLPCKHKKITLNTCLIKESLCFCTCTFLFNIIIMNICPCILKIKRKENHGTTIKCKLVINIYHAVKELCGNNYQQFQAITFPTVTSRSVGAVVCNRNRNNSYSRYGVRFPVVTLPYSLPVNAIKFKNSTVNIK